MRRIIHPLVVVTGLALVATACSGGNASPTTTTADATTTTSVDTTAAATGTTTATDGGDELSSLLAEYAMTPLRATYELRDAGEETIVILSQDPTQDPPVEAVIIEDADAKLITTGTESIFCDTASNQCFSVPGGLGDGFGVGMLGPFAGGLILASDLSDARGADVSESIETIAGRAGFCFTFTPPSGAGFDTETVRQCIDAELGFTLLIQTQEAGGDLETLMELIEFGEPLPADFTPSGPVTSSP